MGVAIIIGGPNDFHFRIDPNLITWQYKLNTHVDETYGGRVIQLLSVSITNLSIQADAGRGGRAYLKEVITFTRDLLLWQKNNPDKVVRFVYPPRGYSFSVHLTQLSIADSLENVVFPYTFAFNVNEDVSGIVTDKVMSAELTKLQEGIGFTLSQYIGDGTTALTDPSGNHGSISERTADNVAAILNSSGGASGGGPVMMPSNGWYGSTDY